MKFLAVVGGTVISAGVAWLIAIALLYHPKDGPIVAGIIIWLLGTLATLAGVNDD